MELQIKARAFQLKFRHPFAIAHGTRDTTDTLYVQCSFDGKYGYGEAALPPYLGYNVEEIVKKFAEWFPEPFKGSQAIAAAISHLKKSDDSMPSPAKAALEISLLDLWGKLTAKPVRNLLGIPAGDQTLCTYTLGISSTADLINKLKEAEGFKLFKLKLGGENDHERIEAFLANSKANFCVDANQAWKSVSQAIAEINFLKEKACLFVEQPLPVNMIDELTEVHAKSKLPIILDESIQKINDLEKLHGICAGINIKLVKCGGITPAMEIIRRARRLQKKVLIGCMSESSCGAAGAAQLAGWADWVDLDGPKLIVNDPFSGIHYREGILEPNNTPGTGIEPAENLF